jgi:hypothetical protein
MFYLLRKKHNKTGLNYLSKHEGTVNSALKYAGSGKYWVKHLKKHGKDLSTEILVETNTPEELRMFGLAYSELWNIVESDEWANLVVENIQGQASGKLHSLFGEHHSIKTRKKMSSSHNHQPRNLGRKFSDEWRANISRGGKGIQAGSKHYNFGGSLSKEHRKKLSESLKGKPAWNKGISPSPETRQKQSKSMSGKFIGSKNPNWKGGISSTLYETH